jgi:hypothetical protein
MFPRFQNHIGKVCALVAATLILPALAFAGPDNGKGNKGGNNGNGNGGNNGKHHGPPIPVVPEAKAGWVLIPFVGAVLIFSWRQLSRAKT